MSNPAPSPRRRQELARIHVLAAQLGLDTSDPNPASDYRQMLQTHGGATSAGRLSTAQRASVLAHLITATGGRPRPARATTGNPKARLIYHLWRSLHAAGHVHHLAGLTAWLREQTIPDHPQRTGWEAPEFLPPAIAARVIEQLKQWCQRLGVDWR